MGLRFRICAWRVQSDVFLSGDERHHRQDDKRRIGGGDRRVDLEKRRARSKIQMGPNL